MSGFQYGTVAAALYHPSPVLSWP